MVRRAALSASHSGPHSPHPSSSHTHTHAFPCGILSRRLLVWSACARAASAREEGERVAAQTAAAAAAVAAAAEQQSEAHRQRGNEAFKAQRYDDAVREYSHALEADPVSSVLYSNRRFVGEPPLARTPARSHTLPYSSHSPHDAPLLHPYLHSTPTLPLIYPHPLVTAAAAAPWRPRGRTRLPYPMPSSV